MKIIYNRGKYDNLTEDEFSWGKNIIFIIYFFIVFFNTVQCGMLQYLEYVYYKFNANEYNIVEATVIVQNAYGAGPLRFDDLLEWKSTTLYYKMDGREYFIDAYSYPEVGEQQNTRIGIKKNNPKKIIRCIPYVMTMDDQLNCIFGWGSIFIIFCYLCVIRYLTIQRKKKREAYYTKEKERQEVMEKQYTQNDINLQRYILSKCSITKKNNSFKIDDAKSMLDVEFHKDFLWCLQNLPDEQLEGLLLVKYTEEKYSFVDITLAMRDYGLPLNYYIIAKSGEHYLCGHEYSSRLFLFSKNLGITNTHYEDIYHYLIEYFK